MPSELNLTLTYKAPIVDKKKCAEENLFIMLDDLRREFEKVRHFNIFSQRGKMIGDFRQLLEVLIVEQSVIISGSGDLGDITARSVSCEFDLSEAYGRMANWDLCRDWSCKSCRMQDNKYDGTDNEWVCKKGEYGRQKCPDYSALYQDADGQRARPLKELLDAAAKRKI